MGITDFHIVDITEWGNKKVFQGTQKKWGKRDQKYCTCIIVEKGAELDKAQLVLTLDKETYKTQFLQFSGYKKINFFSRY